MRNAVVLCALALAACGGMDEELFATEYATLWCEHTLECGDAAQLNFEGITSAEDCYDRYIGDVGTWGDGCSYDGVQAEACLADMEGLTCPADGGLGDPPVSCSSVYIQCADQPDDGTDTDAG